MLLQNRILHKKTTSLHQLNESGFTLIELSIVIVIIGLIVGAIFVGRTLIATSQILSATKDIQTYKSAVNTFRLKYNQYPGDISPSSAAQGFTTRSGATGHGDNNGLIESCGSNGFANSLGCETTLLWSDLSTAGLIKASFTTATDSLAVNLNSTTLPLYLPKSAVPNTYFMIGGLPLYLYNDNWIILSGIASTDGSGLHWLSPGLTPAQAYYIDNKLDDGLPNSGTITRTTSNNYTVDNSADSAGASACTVSTSASSPYNLQFTSPLCNLKMRF